MENPKHEARQNNKEAHVEPVSGPLESNQPTDASARGRALRRERARRGSGAIGATSFSTTSKAQRREHQLIGASAPATSSLRRHPIKLERYRED